MTNIISKAVSDLVNLIRLEERETARAEIVASLQNGHTHKHHPGPAGLIDGQFRFLAARRAGRRLPKGQKRNPKAITALTTKLHAYIQKHPGLRIEQIGKALVAPTKDLTLPVERLFNAKQIKTRGTRRATRYFPK